jgi:hypothetical protein
MADICNFAMIHRHRRKPHDPANTSPVVKAVIAIGVRTHTPIRSVTATEPAATWNTTSAVITPSIPTDVTTCTVTTTNRAR